jgi:uncharacterized protein YidB (DUF937 family)
MGLLDGMLGSVLSSAMGGGQAQDPKSALIQGVLGMLLNQGGQAGAQGGAGGLAGALGGMLGGGQQGGAAGGLGGLAGALGGMLGGGQAAAAPQAGNAAGGLGSLLEAFTKNGMGQQADSWQSTGQNLPISADQLSQVLGSLGGGGAGGLGDILGQLAGKAGVSREDAAGHLSELLPNIVDKLTPNGKIADTSGMDLGSIMQQVLGKA